jgi:2-polyprenyl-6-methoxyphenol hydroxylase-like FAD-dependent oxidoreductase
MIVAPEPGIQGEGGVMNDIEVAVVGAGPTGLMLAGDLAQAGVRSVLIERRPAISQTARAGGLSGQILQLLHLRGELERFRAAGTAADPPPRFPFGGLHLDFTGLDDSPMRALLLPQPELERVLSERAVEYGAEIRRGHSVVALDQDEDGVRLTVEAGVGTVQVGADYVVGCDGGRSRVRELVDIDFPGTAFPEIERLASVTVPDGVTLLADGSVEVAGVGVIPFGYTTTERGVFACSGFGGTLGVYTAEQEGTEYDDDLPMGVEELGASIRRVLGLDLPLGEPLRMTRFGYSAKQADSYRRGRVFLAGDAAHLFPAGGVAVNAGMLDAATLAWRLAAVLQGRADPDLFDGYVGERRTAAERTLLHTRAQVALRRGFGPAADALRTLFLEIAADEPALLRLGSLMAGTDVGLPGGELVGSYLTDLMLGVPHRDPRFAGMLAGGRGALLDLADDAGLRAAVMPWSDRVRVVTIALPGRPADALLVRPDGTVAWAGGPGDADGLTGVLAAWSGPGES